jgi:hypothetical protein
MGELTDERIAPCPKCGGTDTKVARYSYPDQAFAQCRACGANGPDGDTPADAVAQWNAWAEHDALLAEVERLRDGLQEILDMYPHDAEVATLDQIHWFALRTLYPATEILAGPVTDEELTRRAEGELREGIWDATSEGE